MDGSKRSGGRIEISGLRLRTRVGVPEDERRIPQEVSIDLAMAPTNGLFDLGDRLEGAVDYHAVALLVEGIAAAGQRRLIETLAQDILDGVMDSFPVAELEVVIRKFVLADTDHVAVRLWRRRDGPF
ncbi:MAG TPA: dihydroneopterin aldolase [Verrucomicrobiales bacterium]|nr:dihydroneopterin aldolase [Verrucomicrobiales bacterium]